MRMKNYFILLLTVIGLQITVQRGHAQNELATSNWAYSNHASFGTLPNVRVTNSAGTVCDNNNPLIYNHYTITGTQPVPGGVSWNNEPVISNAAINTPQLNRFKATRGVPTTLTIDLWVGRFPDQPNIPTTMNNYINNNVEARVGTLGGPQFYDETLIASKTLLEETAYWRKYRCVLNVVFQRGAPTAYIMLTVPIYNYTIYDQNTRYEEFIIPFTVEGATVDVGVEIPSLGTIKEPQIPYLVLHAPPGANSFSEFTETTTNCREFETSAIQDASNSGKLGIKMGGKGSVGLIINLDYEFYVKFNAGFSAGEMEMTTTSERTCVTVSQGLSTAAATEFVGGGDVFVGYGTDLEVGIYERYLIDPNTCTVAMDTGLIYAPVGEPRKFVKSTKTIQQEIEVLAAQVADESRTVAQRNNDQNQIDVWNQVLAMNQANINASDNELLEPTTEYDLVSPVQKEITVSTINTTEITYEHYSSTTLGIETLAEIGGSGISGGYEFKSSKRFGQTQNQSGETVSTMRYTLHDDDRGDQFNIRVVRDPAYGTPIFKLEAGSKTSCPYQGGDQRDQPDLNTFYQGQNRKNLTVSNIPDGSSVQIPLNICNNSNEARTYYLQLNSATNVNGAKFEVNGVELNTNDDGFPYTVPAGACFNNGGTLPQLFVSQNNNNGLVYENIELLLNTGPDCDGEIEDVINLSLYFGNAGAQCEDTDLTLTQTYTNLQLKRAANTIQATNIIELGADVTYTAGQSITLQAGFHAKANSTFTARIEDCQLVSSSVAPLPEEVVELAAVPDLRIDHKDTDLQVFPNPFNDRFTVTFDLEQEAEAEIRLISVDGKVRQQLLAPQSQVAGAHQMEWDGPNLPPGIYIIQLRLGSEILSRKLVKMR
ncbi:T9SS type A sorting domain-containing protein [Flavilitoribacter nigricans]|nr:T9SS type A sorting domain-containing protein [Flavilitoribacter nigricans]